MPLNYILEFKGSFFFFNFFQFFSLNLNSFILFFEYLTNYQNRSIITIIIYPFLRIRNDAPLYVHIYLDLRKFMLSVYPNYIQLYYLNIQITQQFIIFYIKICQSYKNLKRCLLL